MKQSVSSGVAVGGGIVGLPEFPPVLAPSARDLNAGQRQSLLAACGEILECYRVLERAGLNVVGEILRGQGEFIEYEHYPKDEVGDAESRSQYYYHAHRTSETEHGHFHTFIRTGLLDQPTLSFDSPWKDEAWPRGENAIAHLIAVAMDDWGYPIGLFTTNRWVTDETWYSAEIIENLLDRFVVDHAGPSWPVNRWITAMLRLFRPHISVLLKHRDMCIQQWQRAYPKEDVLEDRRLEVMGYLPIDVSKWMTELQREE